MYSLTLVKLLLYCHIKCIAFKLMAKQIMNKLLAMLVVFSLGLPVLAADTATVNATVTAQNISVTINDGSVSYGIMALGTSRSTISGDLNDQQTAQNNGNVAEDFNIRGQNSANWTLAATIGTDQYVHRFCTSSCTTPPTNYTALTTSYQTLANSVAPSGTQVFDLQLSTPSATTTYTSQSVDVIVLAVAD